MTELQASQEDLRAAYRLILGREPDSAGFSHYMKAINERKLNTQQLCATFLASTEAITAREKKIDLGGVFAVVDETEPEFGRHIAHSATWEPHIVETVKSNLSAGQVFVDVGANVGIMSFHAARIVGSSGKVISFEPNADNARLFLRGTFENGFQNCVRLYQFALSDRSGIFSLHGGSNTHLVMPTRAYRLAQSVPGDDILAHEPKIDFIKIDIEGHEPFALNGLQKTIRRDKPLILCEYNPRCLGEHIGVPPEQFAEQIFKLTSIIEVIEHSGEKSSISNANQLGNFWSQKNDEASRTGFLPNGMLHFDILFRCGL